MTSYQVGRN